MRRRHFLQLTAGAAASAFVEQAFALPSFGERIALQVSETLVELAPGIIIKTTAYNGQVPGPILRMREGVPATISVKSLTPHVESVQWYGLPQSSTSIIPIQESVIKSNATLTYRISPTISGTRWYRAYSAASAALENQLPTMENGQFGFLIISPRAESRTFDQEVFLAIRHWNLPQAQYTSFNDKLLGAGEPIRVQTGERILFRFLNASSREAAHLHLPNHRFLVMALDGNPVPGPTAVDVVSLAPGERIDAMVEMNSPGKWILGSMNDLRRTRGLGIHVEYANQSGTARWSPPLAIDWSYSRFGSKQIDMPQVDRTYDVFLEKNSAGRNGFQWIFKNQSYSNLESLPFPTDTRFRLRLMNTTGHGYSVHLPHHNFSLTRIHQIPTTGVIKDTIHLERYSVVETDVFSNAHHELA